MFALRLIAICAAILLSAFVSSSGAATIEIENGQDCDISLTGPIVSGDYERLQAVREALIEQGQSRASIDVGIRLCLFSPGGSLVEAARISRFVQQQYLSTRILAGNSCLSACAWIFMLGTYSPCAWGLWGLGGECDDTGIDRSMDASATLGFHAPYLDLGDSVTIETELAQQSHDALIRAFSEILSLAFNSSGNIIEPDLLEQAMSFAGEENFFYIDTVDRAGRWNIGVMGLESLTALSGEAAYNACLHTTVWRTQLMEDYYLPGFSLLPAEYNDADDTYQVSAQSGYYSYSGCVVERETISFDGVSHIRIWLGDRPQAISLISIFPPDTRLIDLVGERGRNLTRMLTGAAQQQTVLSCVVGPNQSRVRVINVNEFVNIRTGPSLQTSIVARANLGEVLNITDARFWYYETTRGRQCAILCERYNASTASRNLSGQVQECIEDAQIWQQVRNSRGQTGYVSVYFLEAAGQ